ncbi:MAG: arsenate reductase (glutaredoxin) [Gammaproteobacteria bacterium]|nr:arsenate reductase (glutaredoxin) [Gammaproteobacteria bacterium]
MKAVIYHNAACSKCRATLEILNKNNIETEIVNYLDNPPEKNELEVILKKLGKKPEEVIRFGETVAKEQGLSVSDNRNASEWLDIMIANPILIERPIVVIGDKAVLGRPPENVNKLLEG